MYSLGKYTRFLVTHPLLAWGWGQKLAKFAVFLVAKILKMHIFLTFLNVTSTLTTSKTKNKPLGLCPNPLSLARPQGQVANPIHLPLRWVLGRFQGVQGVKCTTSSPLTLSISVGVAKLTEADGAGNLSRLAKQPRAGGLYRLEATTRSVVRVQEVFPAPCHVGERGCGQRPRCWQDPWGSRSKGNVP